MVYDINCVKIDIFIVLAVRAGRQKGRIMTDKKDQSGRGLNIALGILLVTWTVLLALIIFIFVMRMQGYESFEEWKLRNEQPVTEALTPAVTRPVTSAPDETEVPQETPEPTWGPTPVPTMIPTPVPTPTVMLSVTPTVTKAPTETMIPKETAMPTTTEIPLPTEELTFLELLRVTGEEIIDEDIRRQARAFAENERAELAYEVYKTGNYLSVVFHKVTEYEGETIDSLLPLVYDLTTKKQVRGSDLIKESYFAIIKERLQTYVAYNFQSEDAEDFISYHQIYRAEDYQKFFMTEDSLVFWFEANTLLKEGQKPFSYSVPLAEAMAFFHYNLDGTKSGIAIRKLDPERPMIAFTFDDGPAFINDLDLKFVELFEQYDGRATFFFVGNRLDGQFTKYKKKVRQVYEAGFEVGSHTYTHEIYFGSSKLSKKAEMWQEFNKANEAIASATGYAPDYVRLPGGSVGKWSLEFPAINVNWNVDSIDYREKQKTNGAQIIVNRMMEKGFQDGDIVLFHSIYQNSYDAVKEILKQLDAQGYQFVTLSELFYYRGITPKPGVVYLNAAPKSEEG